MGKDLVEFELDLASACWANCTGCKLSAANSNDTTSKVARNVPDTMMKTAHHLLEVVWVEKNVSIAFPNCITRFPDWFVFPQFNRKNKMVRFHLSDAVLNMPDGEFEAFLVFALQTYQSVESLEFVLQRWKNHAKTQIQMLLTLIPKIFPILLEREHIKKIEFWTGTNEGNAETTHQHKASLWGIFDVFAAKKKWWDFTSSVDPELEEFKPLMQKIVPLITGHNIRGGVSDWHWGKNDFYAHSSKRAEWLIWEKKLRFIASVSDTPIWLPNRKKDIVLVCAALDSDREKRILCHMTPFKVFAAHNPLFAAIPGVVVSHDVYGDILENARDKGLIRALYDYYYELAEKAHKQ